MIILSEYDAFQRITDGLASAADGARMMAKHQPEHGHKWAKMAEVYDVCRQSVFKLAEEKATRSQT